MIVGRDEEGTAADPSQRNRGNTKQQTMATLPSHRFRRGQAFLQCRRGIRCGIGRVTASTLAFTDLNAALRDPAIDAVYVASPVALHAEQTIASLRAGKQAGAGHRDSSGLRD